MDEKIKAFNAVAGKYDDWYEHPQGKQVFLAERNVVNIMIPHEGLGLEVGSGTGAFIKSLENEGRTIVGLDPSTEMIAQAKEKQIHSVLGYGHHAPFRTVFDFTYMVTVIEFLLDPVATLKEIRKITKTGSPYTLLFINKDSSWGTLYKDIGAKSDPVFKHARLYSLSEIEEIVGRGGYKICDTKGTLSSKPLSPDVDNVITDPTRDSGVVVVKAVPRV